MNKVLLVGNVGLDAELKMTSGGQAVLKFRLATTEKWSSDGEKKERTDWHSCTLWGKRAEALHAHITKGTKLVVEGSLRYSTYEDKSGEKRYRTDINVNDIEFAGGRGGSAPKTSDSFEGGDDIPF